MDALPKEKLSHLLRFIADTEGFEKTLEVLGDSISLGEMRRALRELGALLQQEVVQKSERNTVVGLRDNPHISSVARKVLTCLTPREERIVAKTFGFIDQT